MKSRKLVVRLARLFIVASLPFLSHFVKVQAEDGVPISTVTPAGNRTAESISNPSAKENADLWKKRIVVTPRLSQADSTTNAPGESEDATADSEPQHLKHPYSSRLLPTSWAKNTRLIPTEITSRVQEIKTADHESSGDEATDHKRTVHSNSARATASRATLVRSRNSSTRGTRGSKRNIGEAEEATDSSQSNNVKRASGTEPQTTQSGVQPGNQFPARNTGGLNTSMMGSAKGMGMGMGMSAHMGGMGGHMGHGGHMGGFGGMGGMGGISSMATTLTMNQQLGLNSPNTFRRGQKSSTSTEDSSSTTTENTKKNLNQNSKSSSKKSRSPVTFN
ncbi:MAG: hypothetical protein JWM11_7603 [Planctomycetaceae bacterium]|nr:hypothetical protein [Planctomycetaceae bacterium]